MQKSQGLRCALPNFQKESTYLDPSQFPDETCLLVCAFNILGAQH